MNMYAPLQSATTLQWRALCSRQDLVAQSGVVAWLDGTQVALFQLGEEVFAIENRDPKSGANVIGRGIVGSLKGQTVVAAPLYKQHFRLTDGLCLEDPQQCLRVWPARLNGDAVEIGLD
ncbi:MAG TPA: nitrite reductase small subunit NirD [Pseudomonas sp.]|nr:nitrite reductase small subunit NirD [Pseudomonas sp.]